MDLTLVDPEPGARTEPGRAAIAVAIIGSTHVPIVGVQQHPSYERVAVAKVGGDSINGYDLLLPTGGTGGMTNEQRAARAAELIDETTERVAELLYLEPGQPITLPEPDEITTALGKANRLLQTVDQVWNTNFRRAIPG